MFAVPIANLILGNKYQGYVLFKTNLIGVKSCQENWIKCLDMGSGGMSKTSLLGEIWNWAPLRKIIGHAVFIKPSGLK